MKRRIFSIIISILTIGFILSGCRVEITANYDAVIYGSGVSGVTAALDLQEQGKRVLLVEESGIIGGNKRLISDGVSFLNEADGDTNEQFLANISENNSGKTTFFTEKMVEYSRNIPSWLSKYNIQLEKTIKLPGHSVARTLVSKKGVHTGKEIVTKLEAALKKSQVELSYNSTITKIVPEKNNTYQLTIEQQNAVITVNSKTIIFAEDNKTAFNAAVPITELQQLDANNFESHIAMSSGMELLSLLQADFSRSGELNVIDTYNSSSAQKISPILRSYGAMLINEQGNRFVNEMEDSPKIIEAILAQENQNAYLIYDNVIDAKLSFLNEYYADNTLLKTDSIIALSQSLNIDEDTLRSTIANYHHMIKQNEDTQFGRSFDVDAKTFSELGTGTGSLFVIKVNPVATAFASYAEITDKFELMKKGTVLPGIYAIGDSARDIHLNDMLSGTELTTSIVMGNVVSEDIIEYLNRNSL